MGRREEGKTDLRAKEDLSASIGFEAGAPGFSTADFNGQPAVFNAGFFLDDSTPIIATFTADLTKTDFVSGTDIASDLLGKLLLLGFPGTIQQSGDILNFAFNSGITDAGIEFGATSVTPDVFGSITTAAPEPSTLLLLGSAVAGLGFAMRRKRNQAGLSAVRA